MAKLNPLPDPYFGVLFQTEKLHGVLPSNLLEDCFADLLRITPIAKQVHKGKRHIEEADVRAEEKSILKFI